MLPKTRSSFILEKKPYSFIIVTLIESYDKSLTLNISTTAAKGKLGCINKDLWHASILLENLKPSDKLQNFTNKGYEISEVYVPYKGNEIHFYTGGKFNENGNVVLECQIFVMRNGYKINQSTIWDVEITNIDDMIVNKYFVV